MSEPEEDFAAMFDASHQVRRFEKGEAVEGRIVALGPDVALVDVGGKGEAVIDIEELKDADGRVEVAVGDRLQAVVVSTSGGLKLSHKLARRAATARQLEDAFQSGLPVEGRVDRAVKGGYEISIARHRAFCPISQIELPRHPEPGPHEGRVYEFRIIEYKDDGRNIVVSRRVLLEEAQRERAREIWQSIVPGAVLAGRVSSVRDFGAFVDLGAGVQGLLHVSEMSWARVSNASAVVEPGQAITVKVLQVDEEKQKISLGLKQLLDDPWSKVPVTYGVGQRYPGRVTRLAEFGAFVELEPGVEGLAHASTFTAAGRSDKWSKSVPVGTTGLFEIASIDVEKKRIGLSPVPEGATGSAGTATQADSATDELREYVERQEASPGEGFGSLAEKLRGALQRREQ